MSLALIWAWVAAADNSNINRQKRFFIGVYLKQKVLPLLPDINISYGQ
jgi:hypothetical protein